MQYTPNLSSPDQLRSRSNRTTTAFAAGEQTYFFRDFRLSIPLLLSKVDRREKVLFLLALLCLDFIRNFSSSCIRKPLKCESFSGRLDVTYLMAVELSNVSGLHGESDVTFEGFRTSPVAPDENKSAWNFSKNDLKNHSPSRKDGIDWRMESQIRASYCSFIRNLGMELKVPQLTIATAVIFCHRFYLHQSHAKNHWQTVATVCVFLASKVEETPRSLDKVIFVSFKMIHGKDFSSAQTIHQKEVFRKQKDLILIGERLLLATIRFDLNVEHPYKPLVAAIKKLKLQQDMMRISWNFVNDWVWTTLCLQYKPHYIAAGSLYIAAKLNKVELPSQQGSVWWHEFDVVPQQLQVVIQDMMQEIYLKRSTLSSSKAAETSSPDSVLSNTFLEQKPSIQAST